MKETFLDHAENPRRQDPTFTPTATGRNLYALCGDEIEISVLIHDGIIMDIGFTGKGCILCRGGASILCEYVLGMSVAIAQTLTHNVWVNTVLMAQYLERQRLRCVYVPLMALQNALRKVTT